MIEITERTVTLGLVCDCGEEFTDETEISEDDDQIYVECPSCGKSRYFNVKIEADE